MKALIYRRFGSADELEWANEWPEPAVAPHWVLVKVAAGSINPKDVLLRRGKFSRTLARDPLPRVSGMDMAGEVIAVGPHVPGYSVGDAVFGMTNHFAGGIHAEIARLHQDEIYYSPSGLSMEQAASVPLAAQTALQGLRDYCFLERGRRILINGASGGVGHFAVQIAKAMGAEVHAVCGPRNVQFVNSLGADATYSYREQSATEIDMSFDCVFDVFGNYTRSAFARQLMGRGIYVSTVPKPATIWGEVAARMGISKRARLVQVRSRSKDLKRLKDWIENGAVAPRLEQTYPIARAADAHRHIRSRRNVGKICVTLRS